MKFYNAMKHYLAVVLFAALFTLPAKAQQPEQLTPEQKEKQLYEFVDKETERLTGLLKLDESQQFYVTMTLTDCWKGLQEEFSNLSTSGVQNVDLYQVIQDKWLDRIDNEFQSYFTPEQWKKYLRSGADRARKQREKRREKADRDAIETGILKEN